MRRPVQEWPVIPNPVCSPGNHFLRTDLGIAKQSSCHARIAKQRARTLGARRKGRLNTEMFAKLKRQFTYRERFAPGDIQNQWRRFAQGKGPQAPGIRVALPNYVYLRHRRPIGRRSNTASPMSTSTP